MHNRTSFRCPFRELCKPGLCCFCETGGETRIAAKLFALVGVLVSSGPDCIFHLSFLKYLWAVCSYLLPNYNHLHANHLQKQWAIFVLWRYINEGGLFWNFVLSLGIWKVTVTVKQGEVFPKSHHVCRLLSGQRLLFPVGGGYWSVAQRLLRRVWERRWRTMQL